MLRKKLIVALLLLPGINAFSQQQQPVSTPQWKPDYDLAKKASLKGNA